MPFPVLFAVIFVIVMIPVIFWLVRSRGNTTGKHIDTTVSALGAVTEAVEEAVDAIKDKVEEVRAAPPAPAEQAAPPPAPPAAAPVPVEPSLPAGGAPDNLRQLKGVGPKLVTLLNGLGITRFDQIAAWGPAEIETIDAQLGTFKGRIARDNWVEQASFLASGDIAGFEAKFGKLDG